MLPLWIALRSYAPYITFPVAALIGFVGYHLEGLVSDRETPHRERSIRDDREERRLEEMVTNEDCTRVDSLKERNFVPKTVLDRNLSPSLTISSTSDRHQT